MGFYLNKTIKTKLDWEDVVLISTIFGGHKEEYGDKIDKDILVRMDRLVNRLGKELSDNPENDKPNSH